MSAKPKTAVEVAESIIASFHMLPTIPAAASQAIQLLNKSDPDLSEVADVILADQVITARVIRIINSPLYKMLHEVESVKQALIYLGPQKVFEIILTSCFLEVTDNRAVADIRPQSCWEHSFGVALVARKLAEQSNTVRPEMAYVAGILHDVGEVILMHQRQEQFRQAVLLSMEREIDLYEAEKEVFGTTHCEIGALLANQWRFPELLAHVIQHHHDNWLEIQSPAAQVVHLADQICNDIGLACCVEPAQPGVGAGVYRVQLSELEKQFARLGVTDANALRTGLVQQVDRIRQTVQMIYA